MTVVVAGLVFGGLLSPPLMALGLVAWLLGAPLVLGLALVAWGTGTLWMAINAGVRHIGQRRQMFLEALAEAPADVLGQLGRLAGLRPRGLRSV